MKKLIFPSLLLIGINAFSQKPILVTRSEGVRINENLSESIKDTLPAYHVFVDTKNNQVRGYMGYISRTIEGHKYVWLGENKYRIEDNITSSTPLDQRKKPFPKTFILITTKTYDQEPVIW